MKTHINAVNLELDNAQIENIETKMSKLYKLESHIIKGEVTVKETNVSTQEKFTLDIRLHVPGNDLFASKNGISVEEALDSTISAVKVQLEKYKAK
jgi:ribosomal subunit interface protein